MKLCKVEKSLMRESKRQLIETAMERKRGLLLLARLQVFRDDMTAQVYCCALSSFGQDMCSTESTAISTVWSSSCVTEEFEWSRS